MSSWQRCFTRKRLVRKSYYNKRFEYSSLGKEILAQTEIVKKQYKELGDTFEFDQIIKKEEPKFKIITNQI